MFKPRLVYLILGFIILSHSTYAQRGRQIIKVFDWFKNSIPERYETPSPTTIRKADDLDLSSPYHNSNNWKRFDETPQSLNKRHYSGQLLSETGKKLQENYPGSANLSVEEYAKLWFKINEEESMQFKRKRLEMFFQMEGLSAEALCKSINEDLGLIYEFIGKASRLGYEYQMEYSDWGELSPGRLSGIYFDISEFITNIQGFEKKLLGEYADGRWSKEDRQTVLDGINALDEELANIDSYAQALGYDRSSFQYYFGENGIGSITPKEECEKIRDDYQRMSELLDFLNYRDLNDVNERCGLGLPKVVFNQKIENLLKAEKEKCDQLLEILGYETLEDFDQQVASQPGLTTQERLMKEKKMVSNILGRLGFDADGLQQAVIRYCQLNNSPQNYRRLLQEEDQQNIWYARSGKKYAAFDLEVGKNSLSEQELTLRCIEVPGFPNNFVRTDTDGSIPIEQTLEQAKNNYARRILGDEVEMLSLVNESTTDELLLNFKKKLVRVKFNKPEDKLKAKIKRHIKRREGKSLFILGHVEGEQFVTKLDDGTLRLDISEVIDWGKQYKVNIFAFGCNTARVTENGTSQFLNSVTDGVDMMEAIQSSRTVGEIFENYVSDTRKIIVNGEAFQDQQYLRVKVIKTTAKAGGGLTVGVVTYLLINEYDK